MEKEKNMIMKKKFFFEGEQKIGKRNEKEKNIKW